ncbi:hypothetical protein OG765_00745 [Streptomyces sp. NBC_00555]|uniref:hypothetical protein n=1 Tax=Streptomyces sp. NBC_00555 TaxID=2903662 RepID=UPI00225316F8|nr:hypothetical protein [Streptomyces sp. NBC_00555]MCX5009532.1 hypothetical protein [Streptomyces sp. NBC_00555]
MADIVADHTRARGPDHPGTFTGRHQHADWTGQAGDAKAARDLMADLAADRTRVLSPDHPDTVTSRYQTAYWAGRTRDAVAAVDLLRQRPGLGPPPPG